jgi:hypothetical protein
MKLSTIGILICIFSLFSCKPDSSAPSKEVIAEVKGKYLYLGDLQSALPEGLNGKDSAEFAQNFIRNWAADELMYDIAKKNIPDEDRIDRMVEDYRQQLITADYQRYLVEEKLGSEITDEEIQAYRKENASSLVLQKDQIQGLFLKIPVQEAQHNQLHTWMTLKKGDYIEKIEKYAIQHAVAYEYFIDQWKDFDAVMANIPYRVSNTSAFLKQNKQLEVKDSSFYYLLTIKEFAAAGTPYPEELAREEAKKQLISQRKVNYLIRFRNDLMKKAIKDKDVTLNLNK